MRKPTPATAGTLIGLHRSRVVQRRKRLSTLGVVEEIGRAVAPLFPDREMKVTPVGLLSNRVNLCFYRKDAHYTKRFLPENCYTLTFEPEWDRWVAIYQADLANPHVLLPDEATFAWVAKVMREGLSKRTIEENDRLCAAASA